MVRTQKILTWTIPSRILPSGTSRTAPTQDNSHYENYLLETSHPRKFSTRKLPTQKIPTQELPSRFLLDDSNPSSNFDSKIFFPEGSQLFTNICPPKCQNQRSLSMYAKHDNFFKHNLQKFTHTKLHTFIKKSSIHAVAQLGGGDVKELLKFKLQFFCC